MTNPVGRPKKPFDIELFEEMCHIQCTKEEIATLLRMDEDTLNAKCKEHYGNIFSVVFAEKREGGRKSLRRAQWTTALEAKNPIMQIFLGKNMLGQADKQEIEHTGDIRITLDDDLDDLAE